MSELSDYAENAMANWVTGQATAPAVGTRYLALFTAAPNDAGGGTELSGNGYSRQAIACDAASGGVASNNADISFGPCTSSNWGTVTHFAIFDASSAGNMLMHSPLNSNVTINVGDTLEFATGEISITMA